MRATWISLCCAFVAIVALPVLADDAIPGKVVVARTAGEAIVLYDATPEVAAIVHDKIADADANARLERDALRVMAKEAPALPDAHTITVRVTYARTGEVSPVYGTPTFAGIERYANLTFSAADAKSDRDKWKESANGTGAAPGWVQFTIVGQLPPR